MIQLFMLRLLLSPFSFIFGVITFVRNKLYDWKCIPSVHYDDIFVISAGNITIGGTGKTPFVEYLVRFLSQKYRVAVLSRGYKRTTKGFRFVENNITAGEAGDEPYQIKRKFPDVVVAVDADRVRGIAKIHETYPDIQVVLLDDAFQYRKIQPNLSIILADYNRPLYSDSMLPGGRLREWACFAKRADMMVVTKSPAGITSDEQQEIKQRYAPIFPHQLYFT
ncbi:MAG: tetraacyldisaccharide 4'-kinase, partial [Prolixibacteraceae bacterium]|nr:tetraacyldisaccharide 4'-kinase [Prolixibacteraceae bacterium]